MSSLRSAFLAVLALGVPVQLFTACGAVLAQCVLNEDVKLVAGDGAPFDRFGGGVALEGDVALIGAPFADTPQAIGSGKVYVYRLDPVAEEWLEEAQLLPSGAAPGDCIGGGANGTPCHCDGVALSGDVAVVGAHFDDDLGENAGAVYIFRRDPSSGEWHEEQKLTASDGGPSDGFGRSLSADGDVILVGAGGLVVDAAGAAYLFRYDGGIWVEEAKLTAFDGQAGDRLGTGVGLSGDLAVAGAPFNDEIGVNLGAAYLYRHDAAGWSFEAKLTPDAGEPGDAFGFAVSAGDDVIAIGAPASDDGIPTSGAVYIFRRDPGTGEWTQEARLAAAEPEISDEMGLYISMDGSIVAASAIHHTSDPGEVHVFQKHGGFWREDSVLVASDLATGNLGFSVSVDGDRVLAGAPRDHLGQYGFRFGSAYFFDVDPGCELPFLRGDPNGDGAIDIADAVSLLNALFVPGAPQVGCGDAADSNDDGIVNLADVIALLSSLFVAGAQPLPPPVGDCGLDPTLDLLDCGVYEGCP